MESSQTQIFVCTLKSKNILCVDTSHKLPASCVLVVVVPNYVIEGLWTMSVNY